MEIVPNVPMNFLTANLSDTAIDIHKGMKVAGATDLPGQVVQLGDRSNLTNICKVRLGERLDFESKVDGTISKELEEPTDWKDRINLPEKFEHEKPNLIEMLTPFSTMWDGTLGTIKAAIHRI